MRLVIDDGKKKVFDRSGLKGELTVGREKGVNIVLPEPVVSSLHATFSIGPEGLFVVDSSTNGTFVNGQRIAKGEKVRFKERDIIRIGSFRLIFYQDEDEIKKEEKESAKARGSLGRLPEAMIEAGMTEEKIEVLAELRKSAHRRLLELLDLRWVDFSKKGDKELRRMVSEKLDLLLSEMKGKIPFWVDLESLKVDIINEVLGLGPLEEFLQDREVSEVMVVDRSRIYIEKKGKIIRTSKTFTSDDAVMAVIEKIVSPLGKRIDESNPIVDARLKDGSRVNAIIPPLAIKGPCITIRKFPEKSLTIEDLIRFGSITPRIARFLELCVKGRRNIVVSGGTGTGKTTILNILSSFIPEGERIITIEDTAELRLPQDHVVSLETRPPNVEGKGAVTIRDLVKNALRMRPDRIVVGECRGGEALDMLQAMNTGHDGSLTTLHANSPEDALSRLETMVLMSGMELPVKAIRDNIAGAIDLIVQQTRFPDGSRKVTQVAEVLGLTEEFEIRLENIYEFRQYGIDETGKVRGKISATGYIPSFIKEFERKGLEVPSDLFVID